jgi:hypothetical protein
MIVEKTVGCGQSGSDPYFTVNSSAMQTTAPKPTTAAATLRPTSTGLSLRTLDAAAAGRGAGTLCDGAPGGRVTVEPVLVGGRAEGAPAAGAGLVVVGGRGGAGAAEAPVGVEIPDGA